MENIVIVDDSLADQEKLEKYVRFFFDERGESVSLKKYTSGLDFLASFSPYEDIIFLDIDLPGMNGIDVARKVREVDSDTTIIFISNLAQFAIKGYEVGALDYVVKPFNYSNIEHRLKRALNVKNYSKDEYLVIKTPDVAFLKVPFTDIAFMEKDANYVIIHTDKEEYRLRGAIKDYEGSLPKGMFSSCCKGFMVNLSHVEKAANDSVYVNNAALPLSRSRKKEFMNDLFEYFGQRKGQ